MIAQVHDARSLREQLRHDAIGRRDDIPANLRGAFSHMIKKSALEILEELGVKTVHCYLSFRSEVATEELIHALQASHVRVVAPATIDGGRMEHYLLTTERVRGAFGVPEPMRIERVEPREIEAVILPVVSFDGTGTRLGYGKGFYDRFLSELSPAVPRIGLAFAAQESDSIPRLEHDQPLTMIVTEQGIVKPGV